MSVFFINAFSSYFCVKCLCQTSGIIPEGKEKDTRWCISCHSQLVQCENCFVLTSTTIKGSETICDRCQKPAIKAKLFTIGTTT